MRIILAILASITFLSPKAQTHLPVTSLNYNQWSPFPGYNPFIPGNYPDQKWHLSKYTGLSAGSVFFAGGSTSFLSAPVGLQLSYQLNKNLYPFARISAAPTVFSFSRLFTDPALSPSYPGSNFSNAYGFGLNSSVEGGLMYINDAKTFSISGSVRIDRNSYPVYPSNRTNTKKQ